MKKSIGFLTLAAVLSLGAAEPFPNPSMIHRYVGSDTNETWQGVVNNGVVCFRACSMFSCGASACAACTTRNAGSSCSAWT